MENLISHAGGHSIERIFLRDFSIKTTADHRLPVVKLRGDGEESMCVVWSARSPRTELCLCGV